MPSIEIILIWLGLGTDHSFGSNKYLGLGELRRHGNNNKHVVMERLWSCLLKQR